MDAIDFLKDFSFLETLHINSVDDFDFSFLKNLVNLKDLLIGVEGKKLIDLSYCVNLEKLTIEWRKEVRGIEKCGNLQLFSLYGYKKSDLSQFAMLTSLKKLIMKSSAIGSLNGINALAKIENIRIANCKKLNSVLHLNGLNKLEYLEFNTCPNIVNFSSVKNLPNLKTLYLIDCEEISSIKFIHNFPLLETFGLLGNTNITDGDTLPAKGIQHLSYRHYPHYNFKIPTPEADALEKRNLDKIKRKKE